MPRLIKFLLLVILLTLLSGCGWLHHWHGHGDQHDGHGRHCDHQRH